MIPNYLLNDLAPDDCVAILTRGGEIHFLIHPIGDTPEAIRARAEREGSQVLTSHLRDHQEILDHVASRERDVGGEG